jgi:hypothetical protein
MLLVGCEPGDTGEHIGLSAAVERSIEPAVAIVHRLLARRADDVAVQATAAVMEGGP